MIAAVRKCLHTWVQRRDEAVLMKLKLSQAEVYANRKLLTSAVNSWKVNAIQSKAIKVKSIDDP